MTGSPRSWTYCSGSRPGLLAVRLALLVGLPVKRSLVGRLTWIWLLLSVRLLRRIRRLTLPLVRLVLAVRIPWRLLAHDALPCTAPDAVPSHFKDAAKTSEVCGEYQPDIVSLPSRSSRPFWHRRGTCAPPPSCLVDHLIHRLCARAGDLRIRVLTWQDDACWCASLTCVSRCYKARFRPRSSVAPLMGTTSDTLGWSSAGPGRCGADARGCGPCAGEAARRLRHVLDAIGVGCQRTGRWRPCR